MKKNELNRSGQVTYKISKISYEIISLWHIYVDFALWIIDLKVLQRRLNIVHNIRNNLKIHRSITVSSDGIFFTKTLRNTLDLFEHHFNSKIFNKYSMVLLFLTSTSTTIEIQIVMTLENNILHDFNDLVRQSNCHRLVHNLKWFRLHWQHFHKLY